MLERDPEKRVSIYDVISDPWVTNDGAESIDLDLAASISSLSSVSSQIFSNSKAESHSITAPKIVVSRPLSEVRPIFIV